MACERTHPHATRKQLVALDNRLTGRSCPKSRCTAGVDKYVCHSSDATTELSGDPDEVQDTGQTNPSESFVHLGTGNQLTAHALSLAPGQTADISVACEPRQAGSERNTATFSANGFPPTETDTTRLTITAAPDITGVHAGGSQASGKVTVPGSGGTRKEVAAATSSLAQIKGVDVAVASTKGRTCKFLNTHGRMVGRPCGSPIWLHAKGTTKWSYRFKRKLARGRTSSTSRP